MSHRLHPPILSYGDLRRRAGDSLRTHHSADTIPIPIEEIVEFQHRIDIIPVPGLHKAFEVDAFISSDLKAITVDAFVYEQDLDDTTSPWLTSYPVRFFTGESTKHTDSSASRTGNASSGKWTRGTVAGWSGKRMLLRG